MFCKFLLLYTKPWLYCCNAFYFDSDTVVKSSRTTIICDIYNFIELMDWRWFVRGLMYLNEDFEGGDFYFTDENMESQVSKICNFFLTLYN